MKNEKNQEIESIEEPKIGGLTRAMLNPEYSIYRQCSPYTKSNINVLAKYVAFGVGVGACVFGASISKFGFNNNPLSYLFTLPLAGTTYWLIDRSIAMSHAKKAKKKKHEDADANGKKPVNKAASIRLAIALIFAIFNGLLIDSYMFAPDITAALQKETIAAQAAVQASSDSTKNSVQAHKERLISKIHAGQEIVRERNDELVNEAYGLSPTHVPGLGVMYSTKQRLFEQERQDFQHEKTLLLDQVAKDDSTIAAIDVECKHQKAAVHSQISKGFIHQFAVLYEIIMQDTHTMMLAALFYLICIVIELIPLFGAHQIDIREYFKLAKLMTKAHAMTAVMENKNKAKQTEYRLQLENTRIMRQEYFSHAQQLLGYTCSHHEETLKIINPHIKIVTDIEADMRQQFPLHYDEHLRPVLQHVFNKFHENEQAAQNYIPMKEEMPKLN